MEIKYQNSMLYTDLGNFVFVYDPKDLEFSMQSTDNGSEYCTGSSVADCIAEFVISETWLTTSPFGGFLLPIKLVSTYIQNIYNMYILYMFYDEVREGEVPPLKYLLLNL